MVVKIKEITNFLDKEGIYYSYFGKPEISILGFCSLNNLASDCITWIKKIKEYDITCIEKSLNLLIVVDSDSDEKYEYNGYNFIVCKDSKEVYFSILSHFFMKEETATISQSSTILTENIGENVTIGEHCFIGKNVTIGNKVIIKHNVIIDCKAIIGDDTIIYSGVVIGTDGFGYYTTKAGIIRKVPHFGGVIIGKNVEIGANTCIDRGTMDDTVICDNAKIDNLCHIAHNTKIEENVFVIALSMLGGSSKIRKNSYIAPCVAIMNQITIGEDSLIGMGAVVIKDVESNKVVAGVPAKVLRDNK